MSDTVAKSMDALILIDLQKGLLEGDAKRDVEAVVERLDGLAQRVRDRGGRVVFVQHDGKPGEPFEPLTPGWEIIGGLDVKDEDLCLHKTRNDAFFDTTLNDELERLRADRLLIGGWATDFCVDATIRSAVALGYAVTVIADGHTLSDRPHLSAEQVIEHHEWVWQGLIGDHPVEIVVAAQLP